MMGAMELRESNQHDRLVTAGWIVAWIVGGIFAVVGLLALGALARGVARDVVRAVPGMLYPAARIIFLVGVPALMVTAIALPIVIVVRLVRRVARRKAGEDVPVLTAPVIIAGSLLVVAWGFFWSSWAERVPFSLYAGFLLLLFGAGLLMTDRRLRVLPTAAAGTEGVPLSRQEMRERRRLDRSYLGPITLGAALVVIALVALFHELGIWRSDQRIYYPAIVLTVLALGLFVGTWMGRARWLIALCVLMLPFAAVANIIDVPLTGGVGGVTYVASRVSDLQDGGQYHLVAGNLTLDLRTLDVGASDVMISATVAAGDITVLAPPDTHVTCDASVRVGQTFAVHNVRSRLGGFRGHDVGSVRDDGLGEIRTGSYGQPGSGSIHLVLEADFGSVSVVVTERANPPVHKGSKRPGHEHGASPSDRDGNP